MMKNEEKSQSKTFIGRFSAIFFLILILSLTQISAWEWDNKKTYDEQTKTATIKNSILGINVEIEDRKKENIGK